jgi:hypothetical protein
VLHSVCTGAFGAFYRIIQGTAGLFAGVPGMLFGVPDKAWFIPLAGVSAVLAASTLPLWRGPRRAWPL